MDSSGGAPPPNQNPWPGNPRMPALPETDSAGACASQRPHGGAPLGAPVSYNALGAPTQPVFQNVVSSNVSCSPPKPLDHPPMNQGAPMGPVPLQPEPTAEGAPVAPWMLFPQRQPPPQQQQQHLYYEGQQVVQQPLPPQRPPVLQQGAGGAHSGEGPPAPVNMGELPPWQPPMDCSNERSVSFGCTSPCIVPTQGPPPYTVSPIPGGPFVGDLPHISTQQQQHLRQWQQAAAAPQGEALQPPPAAAAAPAAAPPPAAAVAPFPFGMCMGAPQGPPSSLKGGPEAPAGGGPWQPMQQQQQHQQQQHQHQQQQQHQPPQQQRPPQQQQQPQQPHVGGLQQPPGGVYTPMGMGGGPMQKTENKGSRPPKGGGACRRKAEAGVEGGGPLAAPSGTRPAKFFKQHSPGKGAPKPRSKGSGAQGGAQEDGGGAPKDPSAPSAGCQGGPQGGPPSHGGAPIRPPMGGHNKQPTGGFEKGEGTSGPPKANPRPRAVRPAEVMAKMYFHRKKEAWRAELLIEGTKKQKSFSCRLYGYERARLMCEWARKFVLRTSRLPTDEETCTSLASLMKEPLPPQVSSGLPYGRTDAGTAGGPGGPPGGAPAGTQGPASSAGDATQSKGPAEQREQQPEGAAAAAAAAPPGPAAAAGPTGAGGVAAREGGFGGEVGSLPSYKGPLEQRVSAAGICKKRKDAAKCGEGTTKVRKGSDCSGGAPAKKGQAPNRTGAPEGATEAPRRVARADLLEGAPPSGKVGAPGENRPDGAAPVVSPYLSYKNVEAPTPSFKAAGGAPQSGGPLGQELPLAAECAAAPLGGGAPRNGASEEVAGKGSPVMGFRGPEGCGGEGLSPGTDPWFEELEQLKKISRPKGGRAKRFNVGKKPFSGVRGIYFQQGLWKVKYRGEQEEAMKLFPYSPGDEKDMKSQFELARSFLRQVIDKGRQLHDSDGEGLSEDEPAWLVRNSSSSKWACKKDTTAVCPKTEQQLPKSPPLGQQIRRRPPSLSNKGPRTGLPTDAARGGPLMGPPGDCQGPCGAGPYFVHGGPPMQADGGQRLPRPLPASGSSGTAFVPKGPKEAPSGAWVQRAAGGEGDAGELPEEEKGVESQGGGSKAEGLVPWGPSFPEAAEGEAAANSPPELPLPLQLPLMQCRAVFTTADSPMCGRPSPKERSPFSTEATTGFFSAVTTTADEALPVTSCTTSEGPPTAQTPCPSKASGGPYAASYFCCQPFTAPTEGRGGGPPPPGVSRPPEGAPMVPLPTNGGLQEADVHLSHGEFAPPSHEGPSGGPLTLPLPYPVGGPPPAAAPMTLFQPSDGTPRSPESFLQFRPFVEQPNAQLETSLGEELLSVAGYSCGFGFSADGAFSSKQQINQSSPLLPNRPPNGVLLLPGHDPAAGAARGAPFGAPGAPWAVSSPLSLHKPREDNRARNTAGALDKTDPVLQGAPGSRARSEADGPRPPATLPWVVVRPREDEEKALTPLAGKASGYLLQGAPMGCSYMTHHAN
ncbi:hypothetical protein, conserved [Eimeria brunetti]|uniref:Uncharacterized protein n=1 Tax=Eimeria brunetti TaxID=51314 RepID=U6L8Q8_9EIME|nr:hypothetical protein, conserved [Eimeria brunetti]